MKLATLKDGSRDGTLIVVKKDLSKACKVPGIATTMQDALDRWQGVENDLTDVYKQLNQSATAEAFDLDTKQLMAPLPRSYHWVDGSAYVTHVELVRKARGAELPEDFWTDPLMYQGVSDQFLGANDPVLVEDESWGIDFEAEIGVITDDVPMGIKEEKAGRHIKLLVLLNDVSLRNLIPEELKKGFGFLQSKPTTTFSPVAVTPDELGQDWQEYKVNLPLYSYLNGSLFGKPNAGVDMTFSFARLVEHAAKSRKLTAGSIVGSGTISNQDRSKGSSCIAERRMLEIIEQGEPRTSFLQFGDKVKIEMLNANDENVFGSIEQEILEYRP
ncbi:MAG: fumarylacetoacetate hydrolase family protein [Proteobacteria bacterium]|nr:fumarylacetoacetate hydrolase family protein [Pseudomonadota bacterium]